MTPDDLINEYYSQSKLMRVIKSVYLVINYDKYKLGGGRIHCMGKIPHTM